MTAQNEPRLLRIGVPSKGRLAELSAQLLNEAGLPFKRSERSLFVRCRDLPIEVIFLRADDIPVLIAEGAIDLGITGADLVAECGLPVVHRLNLGIGSCRLALCVSVDSTVNDPRQLAGKRIATSFPRVTRNWLAERGVEAHIVEISGSVEIMIQLNVADAIVDLVETGSTLTANQLRVLDEIGRYETVLMQHPQVSDTLLADRIVRRLEGIVIART